MSATIKASWRSVKDREGRNKERFRAQEPDNAGKATRNPDFPASLIERLMRQVACFLVTTCSMLEHESGCG